LLAVTKQNETLQRKLRVANALIDVQRPPLPTVVGVAGKLPVLTKSQPST